MVHYTSWPFLLGDLGCRSCRKVLLWQKVVLMPRGQGGGGGGDRIRLMASEVPLMYGIVAKVVTLGGCEREV